MNFLGRLGLIVIILTYWVSNVHAQKKISIHSENNQIIDATFLPATQYLNGDVKIYHANTFMYCDTAILRGNLLKMRHNVVLLQNDTIKIFSDSMRYDGDSLVAYLYGDVILEDGPSKRLFTTYLKYDVKHKIAWYTQNARLEDKTSSIVSRRGKYALNENQVYFYDNVLVTGEDFKLKSDSLSYNTLDNKVFFLAPVEIHKDTSHIYSKSGWFNLEEEQGQFINDAQYVAGDKYATADTLNYDGKLNVISLIGKDENSRSIYVSSQDTAYAQIIIYNEKDQEYRLENNGYYKSKTNEVSGESIFYNKHTEKFKVLGRSKIIDGSIHIKADTLDYDKSRQFGIALGNVIWRDTSAKTVLYADHVTYHGKDNDMLVFNYQDRPMMVFELDGDSLYMKADTFRSNRVIKERVHYSDKKNDRHKNKAKDPKTMLTENMDNTNLDMSMDSLLQSVDSLKIINTRDTLLAGIIDTMDYFVGDGKVRIFKSNMQAVCDSIVFSKMDSIFTLYRDPIMWFDSTQISGDTISMLVKNSKIDQVNIKQNGTIISSEDMIFYDQIQGREIDAHFVDGNISDIEVNGNARFVYYLKDDEQAYIGVNTTEASVLKFLFNDKKVKDIKTYTEPISKVHSMQKADHETLKIEGFKLHDDIRPLSKENL